MRANLLFAFAASFWSFISSTLAAEIFMSKAITPEIYLTSDHTELHFRGPVEQGDFDRFRRKATGSFTLVLDSPGGRLDEALKIIDFIVSPPDGVVIQGAYLPENARCYSACAFIFMHAGFGSATNLRMHYTASLGFQAPWLDGFSTDNKLFADSPRAIKELMKHGRLPLELLLEFLDKGPEESYLIDTPYEAARYGIVVGGFYDHELYSKVVTWPEDGWFGLVAPTRSSAFWAMGAHKVNTLRSSFAYLDFAPWLGFSSRPIPQSTAEIIAMESFESFEDVDEWVKRNPDTSGIKGNHFKGTLNVEAGLNGITIHRSPAVSNSETEENRDEEVVFHLLGGVLRESGLLRGAATVRFSTQGLFVCCGGPNENQSEWTQLNYLLALPPGMKLKDIPEFLRKVIADEPEAERITTVPEVSIPFTRMPADTGIKLCNNTHSGVRVALGYKGHDGWVSEGWWYVNPNVCEMVLSGGLVFLKYYIHAAVYDKGDRWGGEHFMCTREEIFSIRGLDDCENRGFQKTGFFEVDVGSAISLTVSLGNPGRPSSAGRPQNWEGYWAVKKDWCQYKDQGIEMVPMKLNRHELVGYETSCKVAEIDQVGDELDLRLNCSREGMDYEDRASIRVFGRKMLRVRRDGKSTFFHRCD